jgi:preprotein translocase subunit YajC
MSLPSLVTTIFAQATNAAAAVATGTATTDGATPAQPPPWTNFIYIGLFVAMAYFALIRPQQQAKKKAVETIKGARTGDKIVTTGGIHGVITNVKDGTFILKIADNVKIEIEKSSVDKITRADNSTGAGEKIGATKA